jgi:nitroimidazol reductase NimA-like FMN-containing flavoprotein (pyridoxamine 5'-phosphate oxidase superfamily)
MGVRLSEDEAWAFLEQGHTGILTSMKRDGFPVALPVWYAVVDRHVFVGGPGRSKKFARIRNNDKVSFLVEGGERWAELKAVHLTGRAEIVDADAWPEVDRQMDTKYAAFRTARNAMPDATRQHYSMSRGLMRITPEGRLLTWDNAKLGLP